MGANVTLTQSVLYTYTQSWTNFQQLVSTLVKSTKITLVVINFILKKITMQIGKKIGNY